MKQHRPGRTIALTCAGCQEHRHQRVDNVLAVEQGGALLVMWPCRECGPGVQEVTAPASRLLVLRSGVAIRRAGQVGWPPPYLLEVDQPRPARRRAPLTRLVQLVQSLRIL